MHAQVSSHIFYTKYIKNKNVEYGSRRSRVYSNEKTIIIVNNTHLYLYM